MRKNGGARGIRERRREILEAKGKWKSVAKMEA